MARVISLGQELPDTGLGSEQQESPLGFAGRTLARTGARAAETLAGTPGNLLNLALGIGSWATGGATPTYEQVQEKVPLLKAVPTSGQLRESVTEPLTGEYLKPQGKGEQFYDEVIEDVAGMFFAPGVSGIAKHGLAGLGKQLISAGGKSIAKEVSKKAALAAGAGAIGKGVESAIGSPLAGGIAKIGSLALLQTAAGKRAVDKLETDSYATAEEAAKNLKGDSRKLSHKLTGIRKGIARNASLSDTEESGLTRRVDKIINGTGTEQAVSAEEALSKPGTIERSFATAPGEETASRITPTKTTIMRPALVSPQGEPLIQPGAEQAIKGGEIAQRLQGGGFFVDQKGTVILPQELATTDAMRMLKQVNAIWPEATKAEKDILRQINGALNEFISDTGKNNKPFLDAFQTAQEIHAAKNNVPPLLAKLKQNVSGSKVIEKMQPLSHAGSALFYTLGKPGAKIGALAAGSTFPIKWTWSFYNTLQQSPKALQLYTKMMQAGLQNNTGLFAKYFRAFDKIAADLGN